MQRMMCILWLVATAVVLQGATPLGTGFTYQGQLKETGASVNGTVDFQFTLWNAVGSGSPPSGGTQIGATQAVNGVTLTGGLFTVELNVTGEFGANAFSGEARWLQIAVRSPAGGGGFTTLAPRQPLTPTPHASFALNASLLDGLDSTAFLQSIPVPLSLGGSVDWSGVISGANSSTTGYGVFGYSVTGSGQTCGVGGQSDSNSGTGVLGVAGATSGDTRGVQGITNSPAGRGVFGLANANSGYTVGVQGESSPSNPTGTGVVGKAQATGGWFEATGTAGTGLFGVASASDGITYGMQGRSDSLQGTGVYGVATNAGGFTFGGRFESASAFGVGVRGVATHGTGVTYGGRFESNSTAGVGVIGFATATSGETEGVFGRSDSTDGRGVFGLADAPTGSTYGGRFESNSTSGNGVFGLATAASGYTFGVMGGSDSTSGRGVYGYASADTGNTIGGLFTCRSTSGQAVVGWANAESGSTYGVVGMRSSMTGIGYAVYAEGDLGASGFKSFRVDHPDDPENKYLLHYSAESPEVINIYSETVTLDDRGEAEVELPHYFAKINTRPRYQLTAVGLPMPNLHVAEKIDARALAAGERATAGESAPPCTFRIAGGAPGGEVSWEVKAVRNDLWMRNRAASVEIEKQGRERGKYQHPELYGQPREKGMNYHEDRELSPTADPGGTQQ